MNTISITVSIVKNNPPYSGSPKQAKDEAKVVETIDSITKNAAKIDILMELGSRVMIKLSQLLF